MALFLPFCLSAWPATKRYTVGAGLPNAVPHQLAGETNLCAVDFYVDPRPVGWMTFTATDNEGRGVSGSVRVYNSDGQPRPTNGPAGPLVFCHSIKVRKSQGDARFQVIIGTLESRQRFPACGDPRSGSVIGHFEPG